MSRFQRFRQWCRPRLWLLWLPLTLIWLEGVIHVSAFHTLLGRGAVFIPMFTLAIGAGLDFLCCLFKQKTCRRLTIAFSLLFTFWYMVQTVYNQVCKTFLVLYSVGTGGGQITQFWREIIAGVFQTLPILLIEAVPFLLLVFWGRRKMPGFEPSKRVCRYLAAGTVALQFIAVLSVNLSTSGLLSPRFLYRDTFIPELSVSNFGVLTTLRLDAKQLIFGPNEDPPEPPVDLGGETGETDDIPAMNPDLTPGPAPTPASAPTVWADNVLDIDFAALAAGEEDPGLSRMHEYFGSREPTAKNEYTGMFEGKNLIFLTAEGFSSYAADPELTPTLYALANSGFVFENFYNPLWWVSTSDGEYANCQSLIPKSGAWSMYQSGGNSLPFTLGNQFRRLGYNTYAYHDHDYTYYDRNVSHPNMGYDYKGVGNGLELTETWPASDLEMMEVSVPEYLDDTPFHVYYMTVSGHMNYTFSANDMSEKHRQAVAHLDLSEEAQAYLACNIELDRALAYLLEQLEAADILEDTVICLAADHYPYGLDKEYIDELAGHEVEENFELYRSTLILWSGDMEKPVSISKPCSSLDILPTLSNLFGLEYDSRLMMGRDILSDSEALVVFSNHSFITAHGQYNAMTDQFRPYDDVAVPASYALEVMEEVNNMFYYSVEILENDYYGVLGIHREATE